MILGEAGLGRHAESWSIPVIELPDSVLGERKESGRVGLSACAYACPGCPASVRPDALSLRIVGRDARLEPLLAEKARSHLEFASGELPLNVTEFARLKELGVRRIVTPLFAVGPEHDRISGVTGSFDRATASIREARAVGLETVILSPLPEGIDKGMGIDQYQELRTLIRLTWALRSRLLWYDLGDAPCIASNRE